MYVAWVVEKNTNQLALSVPVGPRMLHLSGKKPVFTFSLFSVRKFKYPFLPDSDKGRNQGSGLTVLSRQGPAGWGCQMKLHVSWNQQLTYKDSKVKAGILEARQLRVQRFLVSMVTSGFEKAW